MGLIDLKTNLKDLKFGKDRIYGGSSNQPYIQTSIPDQIEDRALGYDFILRGGLSTVQDSLIDVKRLGKYFIDLKSPSGLLFVAKQNLLSRTAVRTQASTGILNEGVYTPLSTLIEAGGVAFGLHVNKQGLNPFEGIGDPYTPDRYAGKIAREIFEAKNSPDGILKNRLFALYESKIQNESLGGFAKVTNVTSPSDQVNLISYIGGPGSTLGIGTTNIKFADQRTGENNPDYGKNSKYLADKHDVNINYNNTLGLSVSSSVSPILNNPRYTNINNLGQQISIKTNPIPTIDNTIDSQIIQPLGVSDKWNLNSGSVPYSLIPSLVLTYSSGSDPYYAINSQPVSSTGYLGSSQIQSNILPSNKFDLATLRYNEYIGSTDPIDNLLSLTSFRGSIKGSGSNLYYTMGGAGLGVVKGGIGGILNGYINPSRPFSPSPYNVSTVNSSDAGATYTKQDFSDTNITPLYSLNYKIQDFRKILRARIDDNLIIPGGPNSPWNVLSSSPEYSGPDAKNIEKRVNLGDPGNPNQKNLKSYTDGASISDPSVPKGAASNNSYDKINWLSIYSSNGLGSNATFENEKNDLVNFAISVIDTRQNITSHIHFRAFLNSISDTWNADWNSTKYIGRGEDFYNYTGFDRKVSLSWTVAAQSKAELIPIYKKLNYLASLCAPNYNSNGYMQGNIVKLTIGGYFYEQPGIINGFSYEMNEDNSPWEIGINDIGEVDTSVKQLPHIIKVNSFNFTPIHNFVPRLQQNTFNKDGVLTGYGKERYIALADAQSNNYDN